MAHTNQHRLEKTLSVFAFAIESSMCREYRGKSRPQRIGEKGALELSLQSATTTFDVSTICLNCKVEVM